MRGMYNISLYTCMKVSRIKKKLKKEVQGRRYEKSKKYKEKEPPGHGY